VSPLNEPEQLSKEKTEERPRNWRNPINWVYIILWLWLLFSYGDVFSDKLAGLFRDEFDELYLQGEAQLEQGEHDAAITSFSEALKDPDADDERIFRCHWQLGSAFSSNQEFAKAVEHGEQALAIALRIFDSDDWKLPSLSLSLANNYFDVGDNDKAIEHGEKALAIWLKTSDSEDIALTYAFLAQVHLSRGEFFRPLEYLEKALAIRQKSLGPEHQDVALDYAVLGRAQISNGEYDKAIESYEKALAIRLKTLGPEHLDVGWTFSNLGRAYTFAGDYDKAIEHIEKALTVFLKKDPEFSVIAKSYERFGNAYEGKREFDRAIEYYEKALASRLSYLEPDHLNVASVLVVLGRAQISNGEYDKAIESYEKAIEHGEKALAIHPKTLWGNGLLAYCNIQLGKFPEAISFALEANAISEKIIDRKFSYLTHSDRLSLSRRMAPFDLLGSLGDGPGLARAALRRKGIVFDSLWEDQTLAKRSDDPYVRKLLEKRKALTVQWAKLATNMEL
jgi:tetratricopeptide (TPR) repeat protein